MSLFPIISPAAALGPWRYLQVNITAVDGSVTFTGIGECEWYVDATEYPTVNMTGNSAPIPLVASATGDSGNPPYKAFNGVADASNKWQYGSVSFPIFLRIDLGSGNEILPTSCHIFAPETPDRSPKDFTLEGSNDASSWDVLLTVTGQTGWSAYEERTFNI